MCRSSTKSIGFLLLLWIGIFLPVTEYQVSHLEVGLGSLMGVMFSDDEVAGHEQTDRSDHYTSSVGIDLSDFTVAVGPPEMALKSEPLAARRINDGFTSRDLPPQDRPPIAAA